VPGPEGDNLERFLFLVEGMDAASYRRLVSLWAVAAQASSTKRLERWAQVSGLPLSEIRRLSVPLLAGGICKPDGTVEEQARQIVRGGFVAALEALEASKPKGRKSSGT